MLLAISLERGFNASERVHKGVSHRSHRRKSHSLNKRYSHLKEVLMNDWKKVLGWWVIVILTVALLALLSSSVKAQLVIRAPLAGYAGITTCDTTNGAIVIIVDAGVRPEDTQYVLVHEMTHVKDMQANPQGCIGMLKDYRKDVRHRFTYEAKAYCADLTLRVKNGNEDFSAIELLAVYLQRSYASWMTIDEIKASLPCYTIPPIQKDGTTTIPP